MDLISEETLVEFREAMVGWYLAEIQELFKWSDILPDNDFFPNVPGQRRTLIEQCYRSLDLSDPSDVQKLLHAYQDILNAMMRKGEDVSPLITALQRDGFTYLRGEIMPETQEIRQFEELDEGSGLWVDEYTRLFLCHHDNDRELAEILKVMLARYGVDCFVAHRDIGTGLEWVAQLELALFSTDCLVALMTDAFKDSEWTGQEVGIALGRKVNVVSVDLGMRPFGFLARFQALPGSEDIPAMAKAIYENLWGLPEIEEALTRGLIARFVNSESWEQSRTLMVYVKRLYKVSPNQIHRLEDALLKNHQLSGEKEVTGALPALIKKWKSLNE